MKKLTVVSLLFLLLVACQNQENTEDAQQDEEISTSHQSISMKQTIQGTNWKSSNL